MTEKTFKTPGSQIEEPGTSAKHEAVRVLLRGMGEDPNREGLLQTPRRVVDAFTEMTSGYRMDPAQILSTVFEEEADEIVILRGIGFVSLCEHHLLPFLGEVDIGYLPADRKVVGLSKLARLVDCFARRLQMQERMTRQIAEALTVHLKARGVGVVIRGQHSCMSCRGVQKIGATMITSVMQGVFRTDTSARAELLRLFQDGNGR